jgi:hypothetical protein
MPRCYVERLTAVNDIRDAAGRMRPRWQHGADADVASVEKIVGLVVDRASRGLSGEPNEGGCLADLAGSIRVIRRATAE